MTRAALKVVLCICCAGASLRAQQPELPQPEPKGTNPGQDNAASASPTASPTQLIPPDILSNAERSAAPSSSAPALPSLPELDEAFKDKPISNTAALAQAHAELRQLKNKVANRPKVREAFQAAQAARTDLEKRKLLRRYYEIYFGEMIPMASRPEFVAYLNDRKNEALATLAQPHVRPTATPSPSPPAPVAKPH